MNEANMTCRLCAQVATRLFSRRVLNRIDVPYFHCSTCGLVQTAEPDWLEEAYSNAISQLDTGAIARNLYHRRVVTVFLHLAGVGGLPCIDWAGGHGVFTRLMRDLGFDYRWQDRYAANLFARGFEWDADLPAPFAATAFEVLEHLVRPVDDLRPLAELGPQFIVTSTRLYAGAAPPSDWDYLNPETGQHVAFFCEETIRQLGAALGYPHVAVSPAMQVLARQPIPGLAWALARLRGTPLFPFVSRLRAPHTESDRAGMLTRGDAR